ncbi:MAG: hypothetical protein JO347_08930, partial [Candidatus Eremiobacteraeota bacterium]|nr:hypothetical protein [Candidatus Eremiobacteraeota bacterium]
MVAQFDAVKEATDSFVKIFQKRNWLLGAPTMAAGFLIGIVAVIFLFIAGFPSFFRTVTSSNQVPDISPAQVALIVIGFTVLIMGAIVVSAFTNAWTLVAADPVWLGRDPAFDRGFNRAAQKLLPLCAYYVLVGLLSLVSIITIVGPLIVAVLMMYGPCYIMFKDRSATEAIGDS